MAKAIACGASSSANSCVTSGSTASRPARDEIGREREFLGLAAADAEHVELPEREGADAERHLVTRQPDDEHAAGRRHEVERETHRLLRSRRLDDDLGQFAAVHARARSAMSSPCSATTSAAPDAFSSRRSATWSTSMTFAPRSSAAIATACPIGPAPSMTTCSPGRSARARPSASRSTSARRRRRGARPRPRPGTPARPARGAVAAARRRRGSRSG